MSWVSQISQPQYLQWEIYNFNNSLCFSVIWAFYVKSERSRRYRARGEKPGLSGLEFVSSYLAQILPHQFVTSPRFSRYPSIQFDQTGVVFPLIFECTALYEGCQLSAIFFSLPTPRWKKGSCKLGRVCTFAHGETELTAWNNHLEKMDSELKTKKVEQKDVDSVEESKFSSLVEVEQLTPTYTVIAITTSINRCNI